VGGDGGGGGGLSSGSRGGVSGGDGSIFASSDGLQKLAKSRAVGCTHRSTHAALSSIPPTTRKFIFFF
jgi:hypothetical protein